MARKHYTQFSDTERAFVYGFIRRNAGMAHARRSHFYDKASERSFTFADIAPVLSSGRVIEVHNDLGEWRALIRRQGVCAVLSLQTFDIVTVYYNAPDDNHATLNYALYHGGASLDLVLTVKELRRNLSTV